MRFRKTYHMSRQQEAFNEDGLMLERNEWQGTTGPLKCGAILDANILNA